MVLITVVGTISQLLPSSDDVVKLTSACLGSENSDEEYEILDKIIERKARRKMPKNGNESWIEKHLGDITKASAAKQITVGGVSGWCAGYMCTKVGKIAAMTIGGSLLLIQVASHQGYIKVNWNKVNKHVAKAKKEIEKSASRKLPWILEEVEDFVKDNVFLATGFAGGFLLGMASS